MLRNDPRYHNREHVAMRCQGILGKLMIGIRCSTRYQTYKCGQVQRGFLRHTSRHCESQWAAVGVVEGEGDLLSQSEVSCRTRAH